MRANVRTLITATAVAALVAFPVATTSAPAADTQGPYLQYAPAMPRVGQTLTVYGRGFCSSPGCSRVILTLDRRWVSKPFRPVHGTFVRSMKITQSMGPHVLRASQRGANGKLLQFALRIVFGPSGRD